jgi:hypothetical protein
MGRNGIRGMDQPHYEFAVIGVPGVGSVSDVDCSNYSFQLTLIYKGRRPEIKAQIVDMALNASGIRDTARVLKISPSTVIRDLKKES